MTGDVGVLDDDGYLAITDRKKDIIIRGGENVSAAEVEEILVRMPDVAEVAVVAAPDARLGEVGVRVLPHACRARRRPTLAAVRAHLERGGPRAAEVAGARPRGRRVPAHAERQGAEVRAAPAARAPEQYGTIGT